jgi:hypothetical protein
VPLSLSQFLRVRVVLRGALLAAIALAVLPAAGIASVERIETPIVSTSYESDVAASLVQLHVPLPSSDVPHPAACDWIQYERFRSVTGPTDPMKADAVVVLMPGIMEGASAFDILARNSIRAAKREGRNIEVWALDRRSNCLEDLTGLQLYEQTGNFSDAANYYFHGAAIDGKTFDGWDAHDAILKDIGMAQTMNDYYSVLTNELPSQPWREHHVLCGGHSLGGPLTQIFAGWDFDGSRKTTTDAGYRQCAGFVGFESMLNLDPTGDTPALKAAINALTLGQVGFLRKLADHATRTDQIPLRVDIGGADPVSTMVLEALGYAAANHPDAPAAPLLAQVPYTKSLDAYYHLAGSVDLSRFLFSHDSLRDYQYTNMGLLGQLLDNNGTPFTAIRASFGFFTGGPLRIDHLDDDVSMIPGLNIAFQYSHVMLPRKEKPGGPLIGWANYNQLGSGPTQIGAGLTSPADEVTDAHDLARILYEGPTNFTEPYFPTRLLSDLAAFYIGDRGGDLSHELYKNPTTLKPRMESLGGAGAAKKAGLGTPDPYVMTPGYNHVDAVTAAETQNSGKPEGSSTMLVNMINKVVSP